MAQPKAYVPSHSFASDESTQSWFPGQDIDIELQNIKATLDQIRTNLALIQNDDTTLKNQSVTVKQLSADLQLASGFSTDPLVIAQGGTTGTALSQRFGNALNVKNDFGAKGDGITDDTAAIQTAITAAANRSLYIPAGTYRLSGALTINAPTFIYGDGGQSLFLQCNLAANCFVVNNHDAQGGGFVNIAIKGNAPNTFPYSPGSSGIAISLVHCAENFVINNVWIRYFDTGIKIADSVFSIFLNQVTIDNFQNYGIWTAITSDNSVPNDNRFSNIKIQNISFNPTPAALTNPAANGQQIGVYYQCSGGDVWQNVDTISCGTGLVFQPTTAGVFANNQVLYISMTDCLFDTSLHDNIVFDGTNGNVGVIHFTNCWAAFSTNGHGITTIGPNVEGIQFTGGRVRQNGKHGWNHTGGSHIKFVGTDICDNSKLATLTYNGVNVAANVSDWSLIGCRIGNFQTIADFSWRQLNGVVIGTGCANFDIVGCDLTNPGSGGQCVANSSSSTQKRIRGNLPVLNAIDQVPSVYLGAAGGVVAGTTTYLGSGGSSGGTSEAKVYFTAHQPLQVFRWGVGFTTAPGVGQNFTFQLSVNGVLVDSPVVCSGASSFGTGDQFCSHVLNEFDTVTIRVVTSGGAATSDFRYFIEYST